MVQAECLPVVYGSGKRARATGRGSSNTSQRGGGRRTRAGRSLATNRSISITMSATSVMSSLTAVSLVLRRASSGGERKSSGGGPRTRSSSQGGVDQAHMGMLACCLLSSEPSPLRSCVRPQSQHHCVCCRLVYHNHSFALQAYYHADTQPEANSRPTQSEAETTAIQVQIAQEDVTQATNQKRLGWSVLSPQYLTAHGLKTS